jgi:PPOX class probable F420-dependent enzyme
MIQDHVDENSFAMTPGELDAFLAAPRYASMATLRKDGSPLAVVVGFSWNGESVFFTLRNTRMMVKRLARDPRICINVFNNEYPPKYVIMEGVAQVFDDPGYVRTRETALRYMAADSPVQTVGGIDLEEFFKNYTSVGRHCYIVRPQRILSEDGAKWNDHARVAGAGDSDTRARTRGDLKSEHGQGPA